MQDVIIYQNKLIKIEIEKYEIPWLKIFTIENIKEFSQCNAQTKNEIWRCLDIIEKEMLKYFEPEKINIASFGNYCPHVHFHIQARFKEDSYFPEPTWGTKQRESDLKLKELNTFYETIISKLK
ncbi:MAG: diadenosine tetraphosphate (Ap4A) HIT family hydrolase [Arcobacteraceae bacterium]|jgi:diadenosine tetraphosphate (Ap4A) HIT family hydrolase